MALIGLQLVPPYFRNLQFQQYLNSLVADPRNTTLPIEQVRDQVVAKAASLGIPLVPQNVQVSRIDSELKIEMLYLVHVDLKAYTVDLHFRPKAGGT